MTATTIAQQLQPAAVPLPTLHTHYQPMLALVQELLGVIPNGGPLMEIWPTSFRTYNLLVPNALNLPFSLWGFGAPKANIGLAMYSASQAAQCAYCTAHSCTFALRRGATAAAIDGQRTAAETAVTTIAQALSQIPPTLTPAHITDLNRHFSPAHSEWIILAIGMMGFLNKFMDAMGIELEGQVAAEVTPMLTPTGWHIGHHAGAQLPTNTPKPTPDNLATYWRVIRQAPAAIRIESGWTKGVPNQWPQVGTFLQQATGHDFPLLSHLRHKRVIRALATILRDNLDPATTTIGLPTKALAGFIYATLVGNAPLTQEAQQLARHHTPNLTADTFAHLQEWVHTTPLNTITDIANAQTTLLATLPSLTANNATVLTFALAAAPSPAAITPDILTHLTPQLPPANIIELLTWLAIQQLCHRLTTFYHAQSA